MHLSSSGFFFFIGESTAVDTNKFYLCPLCLNHQLPRRRVREVFQNGTGCELDLLGNFLNIPREIGEEDEGYRKRMYALQLAGPASFIKRFMVVAPVEVPQLKLVRPDPTWRDEGDVGREHL
jgi:hypothetical protein